uniref:Uncharacterized protein n=1 Tax=Podoviridae sp. ctxqo3 TaxID=2827755 RepID=A0A8S5SZ55_9CAUD|nr:MAG TPA: hypothetical protein [Podoviridae sp. ctxqo3]
MYIYVLLFKAPCKAYMRLFMLSLCLYSEVILVYTSISTQKKAHPERCTLFTMLIYLFTH